MDARHYLAPTGRLDRGQARSYPNPIARRPAGVALAAIDEPRMARALLHRKTPE